MIPFPWLVRVIAVVSAIVGPKLWRRFKGRDQGKSVYGIVEGPLGGRAASKRREKAFAWSVQNNWRYDPTETEVPGLWYLPPFGMGYHRQASEVMTGQFRGRHAVSFTYSWYDYPAERDGLFGGMNWVGGVGTYGLSRYPQTRLPGITKTAEQATHGSGAKRSIHVIAMDIPTYVPVVQFIPRDFADRLVWKREDEHVAVESARFNEQWRVRTRNLKFAHSLLYPRYIDRLLYPDAIGRNIRFEGKSILCWFDGPTNVDNIAPTLLLLSSMVDLVPEFIWKDNQ